MWVNEDLNATVKVCKNEVRNVARLANKHGRVARQSGSGVVIDGIYYTHSTLDNLPKEINIAATRTRYRNTRVGSTGHRAPCQTCTLPLAPVEGNTFESVEQAYQYAPADFAQAHKMTQQIRDTSNPYFAKNLGKSVNCHAWGPRRDEVLQRLMKVKFQQNKELQQTLLETRQSKLVECTIDPYWVLDVGWKVGNLITENIRDKTSLVCSWKK